MLAADAQDAFAAGMACRPASAQQVAVPQVYGELIRVAAWLLSPEPTLAIDALEENTHIGHRQFRMAQEAMHEVLRLKAIAIKEELDKLAAAPSHPSHHRPLRSQPGFCGRALSQWGLIWTKKSGLLG